MSGGTVWYSLAPLWLPAGGVVLLTLMAAFGQMRRAAVPVTALVILLALSAAFLARPAELPLLSVDGVALLYWRILLAAALVVLLLAGTRVTPQGAEELRRGEFCLLLLTATLGAAVLVAASHFATLFLGLETLGISLVVLIAYPLAGTRSPEAGIKYLILAGVSSALVLFGLALLYVATGSMSLSAVTAAGASALLAAGAAMVVAGLAFKLSLVPFHFWTPDVYQGSSPPVAALVASVSKIAVAALLLRLFIGSGTFAPLDTALTVIAIASMLIGNLLALLQQDVVRLLAYSSIGHMGYLLVAILAGGRLAPEAASYYLIAYAVTMLGAFAVVTAQEQTGAGQGSEAYCGLAWRRPYLAAAFILMLLSLAGMPLTLGFVGKFYLFAAGMEEGRWLLVASMVVGSGVGLYYYLRLVAQMLRAPAKPEEALARHRGLEWLTALLCATVLLLGIIPGPLVAGIRALVGNIGA